MPIAILKKKCAYDLYFGVCWIFLFRLFVVDTVEKKCSRLLGCFSFCVFEMVRLKRKKKEKCTKGHSPNGSCQTVSFFQPLGCWCSLCRSLTNCEIKWKKKNGMKKKFHANLACQGGTAGKIMGCSDVASLPVQVTGKQNSRKFYEHRHKFDHQCHHNVTGEVSYWWRNMLHEVTGNEMEKFLKALQQEVRTKNVGVRRSTSCIFLHDFAPLQ